MREQTMRLVLGKGLIQYVRVRPRDRQFNEKPRR